MDKNIEVLIKRVIREDLGQMISDEILLRFKPIAAQMDSMQQSLDNVVKQLNEDRRDINQIKIDQARANKGIGVIIENQNTQEDKVVEAVKQEAQKLPNTVERVIDMMFQNKSFIEKIKNKFVKAVR